MKAPWIAKLLGVHVADRSPTADYWYSDVALLPPAGIPVTEANAVTVPAVYDCLQVISRPVASLPLAIFRRLPDGGKERLPAHSLAEVLGRRPNARQSAWEFRGQMQWDLSLYNNAYAEILPGRRGPVDQLVRLDPKRVTARRLINDAIVFDVQRFDGRTERLTEDRVWHLKGLPISDNGITGRPQLETARQTISAALALLDYGARFFANSAQSGGIIERASPFKDPESKANWLAAWQQARTGVNRHKDALLEDGMKYERAGTTNEEAQFLQTRKQLWVELAQHWQVQPHKIGILDRATFSNIEQQSIEFVTDTMLPILTLWEQAIGRDLIIRDDVIFAEFNVAGLLRGDTKARFDAFAKARQWGWLSVNDIRALENLNPIAGGNEYLRPLNMVPVDEDNPTIGQTEDRSATARYFLQCLGEQERLDVLAGFKTRGAEHGRSNGA